MRSILFAVVVLLLSAAPAEAKRRAFCDIRPGATIVADPSHRIYETNIPSAKNGDNSRTTVYACTSGSRKVSRVLLRNRNTIDGYVSPKSGQLSGRWLLMDLYEETGVTAGHALLLYDLQTGKQRASIYAETSDAYDYVLTETGAFAAAIPFPGSIMAFDAAGKRTLAGETAGDLAAAGRRVYWTDNGTSASAELGAAPKGFVGDF